MGASALAICSTLALSPAFAADFPTGTFEAKQTPYTVSFDGKGQANEAFESGRHALHRLD
jgi:hypothetical protein